MTIAQQAGTFQLSGSLTVHAGSLLGGSSTVANERVRTLIVAAFVSYRCGWHRPFRYSLPAPCTRVGPTETAG